MLHACATVERSTHSTSDPFIQLYEDFAKMLYNDEVENMTFKIDADIAWIRLQAERLREEIDWGNDSPTRIAPLRLKLAALAERVMAPGGPFNSSGASRSAAADRASECLNCVSTCFQVMRNW